MNGGDTKIEQLNQLVRSYCVIILVTALTAGYLIGVWRAEPVIADSTFVGVLTFALTWWFKSRDEDKKSEPKPTPPGTVVTSEVKTVQTGGPDVPKA